MEQELAVAMLAFGPVGPRMNRFRARAYIRAAAVAILAATFGGAALAQAPGASRDAREGIQVPTPASDMILAEMRQMLEALSDLLQALARGDRNGAATSARAVGIRAAADVRPEVERLLPQPFLQLGMETHRHFDAIADRAGAGAAKDDLIRDVADLTLKCVACHSAYRLVRQP